MSTILKALRRLEDEKAAQTRASLEEDVVSPARGAAPATQRARLWVASALAAGAAAAFVLAVMWPPGRRAPALAPAPPPSVSAPLSSPVVAAAAPPPPLAPIAQPSPEPVGAREVPRVAVLRPDPTSASVPEPESLIARDREPVAAPPPPPVAAERERAPSHPRPAALARAPRVEAPAAPEVAVLRTVWHPRPDRRTAEVKLGARSEARVLHEGDSLGPLVLLEISPSGVLFEHDGESLRRRVGQ